MKNLFSLCFYVFLAQICISQDTTPPVINCPANITLANDFGICGAIANFNVTATDDSQILSGNLLINGNAELNNLSNWTTTNGGDGWTTTTDAHSGTYAFIGSYGMGTMTQVLDLVNLGYDASQLDNSPLINVSEWYKASNCCSANDKYFYIAELLDASMNVISSFNLGTQASPILSSNAWQQVTHTFAAYPSGLRFIRIIHGSADNEFWAGNYGTVIDDSEVTMLVNEATVTYSQDPGTTFNVGTTTVTATAQDLSGNSSMCQFDIVVTDNQAPVLPVLTTISGECLVENVPFPIAVDNCAGQVTATTSTSMNFTQQGSYLITWNYDDGNGNSATQNQNINVSDQTGPVPDNPNLPDLIGICSVEMPSIPTSTDNCFGSFVATTSSVFPITQVGTTVITWIYNDGHGNTTSQNQNVIITGVDVSVTSPSLGVLTANSSTGNYQWIDCSDNSILNNETNQTFETIQDGNYAVIINQSGCIDTSDCILVAGLAIPNVSQIPISIFPNPSNGVFTIVSESIIDKIELFDLAGRNVTNQVLIVNNQLDTKRLSNDMYILQMTIKNSVIHKEIVIMN